MNGKVYISGAVTNDADFMEKFKNAEKYLKSKGYKVLNPVKHVKLGKSWHYYMKRDIKKLMKCDTIYLLPDYFISKGACLEHTIAFSLDYKVIYGTWEDIGWNSHK